MGNLQIRKNMFMKFSVFLTLALIAFVLSSCGDDSATAPVQEQSKMSEFDQFLFSKPGMRVKDMEKTAEGNVKVPFSLLYKPDIIYGDYLILRKINFQDTVFLQFIEVRSVDSTASYVVIENLPADDEFFLNPAQVIREMADKSVLESRKRFRRGLFLEKSAFNSRILEFLPEEFY